MAKKSLSLKAVPIVIALAALAAIAAWFMLREPATVPVSEEDTAPAGVYPITRTVETTFALKNLTGRVRENAKLLVYAPVKRTSTQRVGKIKVSHPYQLIQDGLGNQLLAFEFENVPAKAEYELTITTTLFHANEPNTNKFEDIELKRFTGPGLYIESEAGEIKALAKQLKADHTGTTVNNTLTWIKANITQAAKQHPGDMSRLLARAKAWNTPESKGQGALHALTQKTADPLNRNYLLTALLRANEIPARTVLGFVYEEQQKLNPSKAQVWVEFFADDAWHIAELVGYSIDKQPARYIAVRVLEPVPEMQVTDLQNLIYEPVGIEAAFNG